jgi:hypothetical protein
MYYVHYSCFTSLSLLPLLYSVCSDVTARKSLDTYSFGVLCSFWGQGPTDFSENHEQEWAWMTNYKEGGHEAQEEGQIKEPSLGH